MLATSTWDGGSDGSGTDLLDPFNWDGDVLPQAGDTAVIGATGSNPTIRIQSASVTGWDTIGGLVVRALGRVPKRGEKVNVGGFQFQVLRADSRRIHTLLVQRVLSADDEVLPQ